MVKYLEQRPFSHPEAYDHYKKEIVEAGKYKVQELEVELRTLRRTIASLNSSIEDIKKYIPGEADLVYRERYKKDLEVKEKTLEEKLGSKKALELRITKQKDKPLELQEFIELFDNMATTIAKEKDMGKLDRLIRKIFSNFSVQAKSVESSTLSAPFDRLEDTNVLLGGPYGTKLEQ